MFAVHWLMAKAKASDTQSEVFGENIHDSWKS
jgi:hypothetical protein